MPWADDAMPQRIGEERYDARRSHAAPLDIHLVEIYSRGLQVRVYTHAFMERMARRPIALFPAMWRR